MELPTGNGDGNLTCVCQAAGTHHASIPKVQGIPGEALGQGVWLLTDIVFVWLNGTVGVHHFSCKRAGRREDALYCLRPSPQHLNLATNMPHVTHSRSLVQAASDHHCTHPVWDVPHICHDTGAEN